MKKRGFLYNSRICIACGACQVACQNVNGLRENEFFRRVELRSGPKGTTAFSGGCNHCANPACVAACPTGAMYRDAALDVVLHDSGPCIGCGACVWNCPYGAVSLSAVTGTAQKCSSCLERRRQGLRPACVEACPMGALRWEGPLDGGEWRQLQAPFLPDPAQTNPSTMARFAFGKEGRENG